MRERRRCFLPLAAVCAALAVSCGPNEQAQTVSFFLDVDAERLNEIEFVVTYTSGKFAATDGQCVVSSAAGPRSFATSEERLLEMDRVRMMSRKEKRAHAAVVRGASATTTSSTTMTTMDPPTTTLPPTTTTTSVVPTTTLAGPGICGNGVIEADRDEQCDDGNRISGDGCDGNCQAEFFFKSEDDDAARRLTITIRNGFGLRPGAALAFCKFQGDVAAANIVITTLSCARSNGSTCTPTTHAVVGVSTTTTTTTTTTSTTSTTRGRDSTTTSSTMEDL